MRLNCTYPLARDWVTLEASRSATEGKGAFTPRRTSQMQEALLDGILHVIVLGTGHAAMWALTLGRWKPTNSRDRVAGIVGVLLWGVLAVSLGLAVGD